MHKISVRIASLFITGLLLMQPARADAQRMLTLEEAVATSLQNNFDILLSKNDSMVAALDFVHRNAIFLPTLNGNAATTYNNNDQTLRFVKRDGSGQDSTVRRNNVRSHNTTAAVQLDWVIFDGFRMFATRAKADEYLKLGSFTIRQQVTTTIYSVITTYYDIVRQKQQMRSVEEQIALNEERVRLAQYQLDIGTGAKPDLLQSKVDLNAQRSIKLSTLSQIEQLKDRLNQAMNTKSRTSFEVSDSIPINSSIALGDIQENIERTNPGLLLQNTNINISRLTLRELRADRWPVLRFQSAFNFTRNDNNVAVNFNQPIFNQNRGVNYGLVASIPIFNQFNVRRLIRQGEYDVRFQELTLDNQKSLLNLDVLNAFTNYQQQKKALELEEDNILLARENVSIVFQTYKLGAATLVQLREAQTSLEDANNRLIAARYTTKVAELDLLRLKGTLVY